MEWLIKSGEIEEFDAIAGGPPCQFGSELTPISHRSKHPNLIPATRELMIASQKAYIIENVEGARGHLINPVMLCGSMFGLPIWRHRYFENNFNLFLSPAGYIPASARIAARSQKRKYRPRALTTKWLGEKLIVAPNGPNGPTLRFAPGKRPTGRSPPKERGQ
jgi:hypothetical protein